MTHFCGKRCTNNKNGCIHTFQAREGGHRAGAFQDQTGSLFWFAGQMWPTQELQQKAAGLSTLF